MSALMVEVFPTWFFSATVVANMHVTSGLNYTISVNNSRRSQPTRAGGGTELSGTKIPQFKGKLHPSDFWGVFV